MTHNNRLKFASEINNIYFWSYPIYTLRCCNTVYSVLTQALWGQTISHASVVAERLRAPNSNSGVFDQQSVGSNPQP